MKDAAYLLIFVLFIATSLGLIARFERMLSRKSKS
jgi:hypothetical protein